MARRPICELKKIMRFNASKSRRGSIDPPDVFNTMEDSLDTLLGRIDEHTSDPEALTEEEIDALISGEVDPDDPDDMDPLTKEELDQLTKLSRRYKSTR